MLTPITSPFFPDRMLQIPAEAFPTRYRCTLYGISAASGKLGSVLGQAVVIKVQGDKHLGITLIS